VYAGAAEADATVRLLGADALDAGDEAYVRIRLSRPLVLDVFDRFVLREMGRRETVAGGVVLDVAPPARPGADPAERLGARAGATREQLPWLLAAERGAVPSREATLLTGAEAADPPAGLGRIDGWLLREDARGAAETAVQETLTTFHAAHPLEEGADLSVVRNAVSAALRRAGAPEDAGLVGVILDAMATDGAIVRTSATLGLATHEVRLDEHGEDVDRLLETIGGANEPTPPTMRELAAGGLGRDVIDAAVRAGLVVRVGPDLVFTPGFVSRAEAVVGDAGAAGITVSAFREAMGTSRKYAVPMLEWFDQRGVTRREGDRRIARGAR
jgi:selenocysteine-specific elongation factor